MNKKNNQTKCCSGCKIPGIIGGITFALILVILLAGIVASFIFIKIYGDNPALQSNPKFCIGVIISYTIIFCALLICATYLTIHSMNHRYHCIRETQKLERRKELFGQNDQKSAPSENDGSSDGDSSAE